MSEPKILNPGIYNGLTLYNGDGSVYNGRGVYNDGAGEFVEIGGDIYPVIRAGNLLWIAKSCIYQTPGSIINSLGIDAGRMYTYSDLSNVISILIDGWRVPAKSDVENLISSIGAIPAASWISETDGGTNANGFNCRLSGFINQGGTVGGLNIEFDCWTTDNYSSTQKYNLCVHKTNGAYFDKTNFVSNSRLSLRLCKDV